MSFVGRLLISAVLFAVSSSRATPAAQAADSLLTPATNGLLRVDLRQVDVDQVASRFAHLRDGKLEPRLARWLAAVQEQQRELRRTGVTVLDLAIPSPFLEGQSPYLILRRESDAASKVAPQRVAEILTAILPEAAPRHYRLIELQGHLLYGAPTTLEALPAPATALTEQLMQGLQFADAPFAIVAALTAEQREALQRVLPSVAPPQLASPLKTLAQHTEWVRLDLRTAKSLQLRLTLNGTDAEAIAGALSQVQQVLIEVSPRLQVPVIGSLLKRLQVDRSDRQLTMTLKDSDEELQPLFNQLIAALTQSRRQAQRAQAMNDLKQIGLALHIFHDKYDGFPPVASFGEDGKPRLSWRVYVLPFLDQEELYSRFHLDEPWDSPHNRQLIEEIPGTFADPQHQAPEGYTRYLAIQGEGMAFTGRPKGLAIPDFKDGLSQTLLVLQADAADAIPWTQPSDYEVANPVKIPGLGEGFLGLNGDGSVQFLDDTLSAETFRRMLTRDEGKPVENQ